MPPKQKEVKKGPTYKPSVPSKDIVSPDIKQPPRQSKTLKTPETFPQPPKNNESLSAIFQQWPTDQIVKAHDFGVNSQQRFVDPFHEGIKEYLSKQQIGEWKPINQIVLRQQIEEEEGQKEAKSKAQIQSFKNIEHENSVPCVIETYMRPQTEAQTQARLKQQAEKAQKAAKDKKKAAKKQQPKEEGPIQVSDVKMSDIISRSFMNEAAIWIGSQLQIIKERNIVDINNNEPIWRKIYPQENGVPQLTKSGKYWIKLLYMGKYIKIEVDDRVPLDMNLRVLFPLSAKFNQKWTLILTKALIKYLAKTNKDQIVGSGIIAYALTGMICQNIPVYQFKEWEKLEQFMSNQHYQRKDIVVSCFSANKDRNFTKLTKVKVEEEAEDQNFVQKEIDSQIINGYSYCIGDYFDNQNFNMAFSQEKSQKEMLLKHEYNQLCKVSISNKSRQQKLEYRKKKKELKEKLAIQEKKRLQLISKAATRFHFLKLLADLSIQCDFGEREILLAKKCLVNKLSQPPNYDIPIQKEQKQTKSLQSVSVSVIKYKQESELFPNIHDFSSIPNVIELLERKQPGVWIQDIDLLEYFDYLQVMYSPNQFANQKIETVQSKKQNSFTYDQNKQILVVEKVNQEQQKEKKVKLLFGYAYQKSPYDTFSPYTIIQKFDFDSFRATSNVVTLDKQISSKQIDLKNQNSVFKLYTMSKGNYSYWISSDSPFKLLSISDYLCQFQGYNKKNISFEYPSIQAGTYFPLVRLKLKQNGTDLNTVLVKLLNAKQELLNCLSYRLVAVPKQQNRQTHQQPQGVIRKPLEKTLLAYEYSRFTIDPSLEYYLIVQLHSEQNVPDGSLQLQLLSKQSSLNIQQCEQVEPIKFVEKYIPNKYGLICKERIFTNNDNNATITVKLGEFEEIQGGGGAGKAAKKGGKDQPTSELVEKPFTSKRNIIVRIMNGDKVYYQAWGINEVTIHNFKLQSTKTNPSKEYYLLVKFDQRLWPECAIKNEHTQKICWVTQIFSTDSLAFVRDTKQEDKEKQTRKSWEDSQPGRAERAKKARRRFLIQMKKENGEALTEQELQILNAPRLTKKQMLEQQKKNEDKKGGKGGKKDDKKGGKDAKKQEVIEQKPVQRVPPQSKQNFMNQIKEFLQILENCVVKYEPLSQQEARIRSSQELKSIKQNAVMSSQDRVGKLIRNIEKRQTVKIKQKEKKQTISIFFGEVKNQIKQKYNSYVEWRNQDGQKDKARQEKERLLVDIIAQEKPTVSQPDLKKHIAEYRQINGHNAYLADVADMVRKNIRIGNLTEKISSLMAGWEIEQLKNINEQMNRDKVEGIDAEVIRQFKQMLEQAEKNPNLAAEKQAQAKKAKKGSKK